VRRAARIDDNHTDVVSALRKIGATVQSLATIGGGCPDLLAAHHGTLFLFEVKDGAKSPSARRLTPDEQRWHQEWAGPVFIVESAEQALRVIGGRGHAALAHQVNEGIR
jgi:hypothetical protein